MTANWFPSPDADDAFLTAPDGYVDEDDNAVDQSDEGFDGPDDDEGREWQPDRGFPAAGGVVRLWTDDQAWPTRLRIALSWRERLKTPLQDPVNIALRLAVSFYHRPTSEMNFDDLPDVEPINENTIAMMEKKSRDLQRRFDALRESGGGEPTRWTGGGQGHAAAGKVGAIVSPQGFLQAITIDEKWAQKSRVVEISKAVLRACREAKTNFVPGEKIRGDLELLRDDQAGLFREYRALLRRGFE